MNTKIDVKNVKYDYGKFIVKVQKDIDYYLKSETYTKGEVNALIGNIQQFHYEIYASTSAVTSPANNILYLIGPSGTGNDKYEEYVYDSTKQDPWVKIGDTTIDLSDYYTKEQVDGKLYVEGVNNNGYTYVDLGLPSGTLWATMNVGANSETGYGNYYMYGKGATQYNSSDSAYAGTEDPLDLSVDTARQVWGGDWHMPTRIQLLELVNNTTYEFTTINGVNGGKFTAQNGNYIFIPAGGVYLSSLHDAGDVGYIYSSTPCGNEGAYQFYFNSSDKAVYDNQRTFGCSVRPVIEPTQTEKYATKTELATKQDTLTFNTAPSSSNKVATMADVPTVMGASGSTHKGGLVPDTPSTQGTTKFLREDGTWQVPSGGGSDINNKADKVTGATNGNFAALDSNGNLTDSGHKHSDYLTSHQDLSNYIQKSNTAGLLKNNGTVDTNSYMKTVSGTTGNIITKSSTSGQVLVSSYSPSSLISSAQNGVIGQDGDVLPTMTLYAIKDYIDSEVARLTALIGGGTSSAGGPGWRSFESVHMVSGEKVLCDADGKIVLLDTGNPDLTFITYDSSTSSCGVNQFDTASSDYASIEALGYGNQTYSATDDGSKIVFTLSDVEYTLDQVNWPWTITPEVSDWASGSSSGLVGCPPKWFDLTSSGGQYDGSKILVNSDGQVVILEDYLNSGTTHVVLLDTNDEIATLNSGDSAVSDHVKRYGNATYNANYLNGYPYKFILNYKEYTIDTQKNTITPDIEDWPKEKSSAGLMWRSRSNGDPDEQYLVTSNGDVIMLSVPNQWGGTNSYTVRRSKNSGQISSGDLNITQSEGWNSTTVQGTETAGYISFEYNGVTYDISTNGQGSITPDVTDEY